MAITIEDKYINRILTAIGYPLVTIEDTELAVGGDSTVGLDNLKALCIEPAMMEYFKYFPLINSLDYTVSGTFTIDFPVELETVFNALVKLNDSTATTGSTLTSNPIVNSYNVRTSSSYSRPIGGVSDYGLNEAFQMQSSYSQSLTDKYKAFRWDVDVSNRQITGYSNSAGKVVVDYCSYSELFSKVKFERIEDVIKLSQAYLLELLASIRGQMTTNQSQEFNYDLFIQKATDLRTEVRDHFEKAIQSPPVING